MLSFTLPITLPPVGTATVAEVTVQTTQPLEDDPDATIEGIVEWPPGADLSYPSYMENSVTVDGASARPCRHNVSLTFSSTPLPFRRGDANDDGRVDISDAITIVHFLFLAGKTPPCPDAADAEDVGMINVTDAIKILTELFRDSTIPPPGPVTCGEDPTEDFLGCASYTSCY